MERRHMTTITADAPPSRRLSTAFLDATEGAW